LVFPFLYYPVNWRLWKSAERICFWCLEEGTFGGAKAPISTSHASKDGDLQLSADPTKIRKPPIVALILSRVTVALKMVGERTQVLFDNIVS